MARALADQLGRTLRTARGKADSRTAMYQAVRAACRRLGIDDDDRRALQQELVGKASMTDMTLAELGRVLDRLNRDWKGPMGHRAHVGKIRALWWTLYWIGAVDDPAETAIDAFVRRQTMLGGLRFLDHRRASSVVDALKSWAEREGVEWNRHPGELGERRAALDAVWCKLVQFGTVGNIGCAAFVARHLGIGADPDAWSRHELDAAIKLVGKRLRREFGRG